jgi:hypothetical protein
MPTSTLQSYALQGTSYAWDAIIGTVFTGGMSTFFILLIIVIGVVSLTVASLKGIFRM